MRTFIWSCAMLGVLLGQNPIAQEKPSFSGRWSLLESSTITRSGAEAPTITAAEELTVYQNAGSLTVEHSALPGTHPKAETHRFISQGAVHRDGSQFRSDTFWFGRQLVIGSTRKEAPDRAGVQRTVESSEMWSLETDGTLVIDVTERRPGVVVNVKLVYRKQEGQESGFISEIKCNGRSHTAWSRRVYCPC